MDKKTIIKLIALFVAVLAVITLLEILIKSISNRKDNVIDTYTDPVITEKQQTIEENFISETSDVLSLFQKRDFEALYDRLNEVYKLAKYPDKNEFIAEMNGIITENTKVEMGEMFKHSRGYYANILLDGEKNIPFTVTNLYSGEKTVMLGHIFKIEEVDRWTGTEDVAIKLLYRIKYIDKIGYIVVIENESNKSRNFSTFNTYEYTNSRINKEQYNLIENINTTISAKSSKRFEMQFPVPSGEMFQPNIMNLCFSVDSNIYSITLNFDDEE